MTDTVIGVTELDGNIYTVCQGSESIRSFSLDDPQTRHRDIVIRGMNAPCDIVACFNTMRLYVADQQGIWLVAPSPHAKVTILCWAYLQTGLLMRPEHSETKAKTETRECETEIGTKTETKNLL